MSKQLSILSWALRLTAAVILGQTLFFKFTAAPESVYIFEKLGIEPWGRIGIGVMELVTVVLLLIPRTAGLGGLLGVGAAAGAMFAHLTQLGIEVQGDGGTLFYLALAVLLCCLGVVWLHWGQLRQLSQSFLRPSR